MWQCSCPSRVHRLCNNPRDTQSASKHFTLQEQITRFVRLFVLKQRKLLSPYLTMKRGKWPMHSHKFVLQIATHVIHLPSALLANLNFPMMFTIKLFLLLSYVFWIFSLLHPFTSGENLSCSMFVFCQSLNFPWRQFSSAPGMLRRKSLSKSLLPGPQQSTRVWPPAPIQCLERVSKYSEKPPSLE